MVRRNHRNQEIKAEKSAKSARLHFGGRSASPPPKIGASVSLIIWLTDFPDAWAWALIRIAKRPGNLTDSIGPLNSLGRPLCLWFFIQHPRSREIKKRPPLPLRRNGPECFGSQTAMSWPGPSLSGESGPGFPDDLKTMSFFQLPLIASHIIIPNCGVKKKIEL